MHRIEIVRDTARLAEIAPAWQALWAASGRHIFQHHAWIAGWAGGVRDRRGTRLDIALAWDGDRLAGAMPCAVQRRAGVRVLTWAAQLFSDYCDCLLDPADDSQALLAAMWDGLRLAGGFDLVSLQQVRPDAACRPFLAEGRPFRTGDRQERCMRIENQWRDGAAFFRSLNKKARNNHTRGKRILSEIGGEPAFRVVGAGEPAGPLFDEILRLKEIWLRAVEPKSTLLGADRAVLRATLDGAWRTGLAKIFLLECGGRIAAASINFCYANRMEAYLTSYDAAFERASPGTILITDYAQWSFDRGLSHIDFLRGEEAFKFRMANAETRLGSYEGARTLLGQVAMSGHRWLVRRRSVAAPPEMAAPA
jgi:CelD/BcsL family acetyltransferase involved in cellulose biosynthesis